MQWFLMGHMKIIDFVNALSMHIFEIIYISQFWLSSVVRTMAVKVT